MLFPNIQISFHRGQGLGKGHLTFQPKPKGKIPRGSSSVSEKPNLSLISQVGLLVKITDVNIAAMLRTIGSRWLSQNSTIIYSYTRNA